MSGFELSALSAWLVLCLAILTRAWWVWFEKFPGYREGLTIVRRVKFRLKANLPQFESDVDWVHQNFERWQLEVDRADVKILDNTHENIRQPLDAADEGAGK